MILVRILYGFHEERNTQENSKDISAKPIWKSGVGLLIFPPSIPQKQLIKIKFANILNNVSFCYPNTPFILPLKKPGL